jgi:hypothetical protein
MHILDAVQAPDRVVIAFLMRGRHVGPFVSPLGTVAPTQRNIEVRTIDVLTVTAGVISAIWVVSDDLGLLRQLDAAKLACRRGNFATERSASRPIRIWAHLLMSANRQTEPNSGK